MRENKLVKYGIIWHKICFKRKASCPDPYTYGLKHWKGLRWGIFLMFGFFLTFLALKIKWWFMAIMGNSTLRLSENKEERAPRIQCSYVPAGPEPVTLWPAAANGKHQALLAQHFERTMKTFLGIWFPNPILLTALSSFEDTQIYYCNKYHLHLSWEQKWLREIEKRGFYGVGNKREVNSLMGSHCI